MRYMTRIKWAALGGLLLSCVSLLVHLLLAKYSSADLVQYSAITGFVDDLTINAGWQGAAHRRLWGNVKSLESLYPYANPRSRHPAAPAEKNNGFIYAKVYGGFEKIRTSICDLVAVSRLLNATLVIPEIQESTRAKGISFKFRSFSYIYNEDQFLTALSNDIVIVKSLPPHMKGAMKKKQYPVFKPKATSSPRFYANEVLPKLKKAKVIVLVLTGGGCLQPVLHPDLEEYQRLRCRVSFHALQFRPEVLALGRRMVERLRAAGQPYLAYHSGLVRDTLAYHGCAELFQDVHTELIQYRRAQMIKQGIITDQLNVDSHALKANGSCPLMPEEVGLLLRGNGLSSKNKNIFGCKQELSDLVGPETQLPLDVFQTPPVKSVEELKEEWDKAGPRPRPLPPPPDRPVYRHEKEGWYGWITERNTEPDPSPIDLRRQAHRLLWAALDYIVSVEADAFIPGFNNDGSGWPDFASLVMGHRLYEMASARTYRPDRKYLVKLFANVSDNVYHPKRNWMLQVREHLNSSLGEMGLLRESHLSKRTSFLLHPIPECSCRNFRSSEKSDVGKGSGASQYLYSDEVECPKWMQHSAMANRPENGGNENESQEDEVDMEGQLDSDEDSGMTESSLTLEQDEEMDPND
ncbi:hypothetical protein NL676_028197 [Syzygium grande]|nr:hypothetical protein NL676_028197 [Syzygium grande]